MLLCNRDGSIRTLRYGCTTPDERPPGLPCLQARMIEVRVGFREPWKAQAVAQTSIRIYVDADACPVKDEIYKVAARHGLPVTVVAGGFIRVPQDPMIERIAAGGGMDAADDWIVERAGPTSIVVTSDIPLASRCIKLGASVIAPSGRVFTDESIGMALAVRNLMHDL